MLLADRALNVFWSPRGEYPAVGKVDGVKILTAAGDLKLRLLGHNFQSVAGGSYDGRYLLFKEFEQSEWVTELREIDSGKERKYPVPLWVLTPTGASTFLLVNQG